MFAERGEEGRISCRHCRNVLLGECSRREDGETQSSSDFSRSPFLRLVRILILSAHFLVRQEEEKQAERRENIFASTRVCCLIFVHPDKQLVLEKVRAHQDVKVI